MNASVERSAPWTREDWWAVWLGIGIVALSVAAHALGYGGTLNRFAVSPPKWKSFSTLVEHVTTAWPWYLGLYGTFLILFASSTKAIGFSPRRFAAGFSLIFAASVAILAISKSEMADRYNLEAPLLALLLGLAISNAARVPEWLNDSLRTEYYIKTGIVLLGATLPLTLIVSAGPIAFLQATIVSIATWLVIYLAATRLFNQDPRFGAVMGAGGSVCGVSASIAVGAAVKARKEHIAISISLVTIWAVVMIFFIPFMSRVLGLETAVAGAWVGTSEFADAAGFAAAASYAPPMPQDVAQALEAVQAGTATESQRELAGQAQFYDTEIAIQTFTLMKVIGRDMWIGIWCFVLSIVAVVFWERAADGTAGRVSARVIWDRFPKFVIGFVIASIVMTVVVKAYGAESKAAFDSLNKELIAPIKTLRTWTFVFAFLCIGLTTRFRELTRFGWQPFGAFTIGVVVNAILGFVLSVYVFRDFWLEIGR